MSTEGVNARAAPAAKSTAGVLALVGRSQVQSAVPALPTEAVDSTKQDVQAVKESARR